MTENKFRPKMTPIKNPELGEKVAQAFEGKSGATWTKNKLVEILNSEKFNREEFDRIINRWNLDANKPETFKGQFGEIESINCKNGKLKVYYYNETNSIKFEFTLEN